MLSGDRDSGLRAIANVVVRYPGLRLVVLFGSRARHDATASSDWDIGYLGDRETDPDSILLDLVTALNTERVDFVDLERAGALVRYRAARDGILVHQATEDAFERFWLEAVGFWCDASPVLRAAYDDLLSELSR